MESAGSEKKIQALFHELKLADERIAPEFINVWGRVQATSSRSWRIINLSFAAATALLVVTLSALMIWSRNGQPREQVNPKVATESTRPDSTPGSLPGSTPAPPRATSAPTQLVVAQPPVRVKSSRWDWRLAVRRKAGLDARNAIIREAVSISSWQSPTATLMQSPADDVLSSLPQLDRSLNQLKTFLPNTSQ
jgi:hypothetical protein